MCIHIQNNEDDLQRCDDTHTQTSGALTMQKRCDDTHTHKPLEPPPDFIIRRRRTVSKGYETMPKKKIGKSVTLVLCLLYKWP
jgi:hypothetical protein